jgi:hypothetical protein
MHVHCGNAWVNCGPGYKFTETRKKCGERVQGKEWLRLGAGALRSVEQGSRRKTGCRRSITYAAPYSASRHC